MSQTVTIEVNGLRCRACHGVLPQERVVGNDFEVTVHLQYPSLDAVYGDELMSTLNYAEVCAVVKEVMSQPSQLLENVCGRIRCALSQRFPLIESGWVRVSKLAPPIPGTVMQSVAVSLRW